MAILKHSIINLQVTYESVLSKGLGINHMSLD